MRFREMGEVQIRGVLMQMLGEYVHSYDAAVASLAYNNDRAARIQIEMAIGKCVQRIAAIKQALENFSNKQGLRDVLNQCLEDCLASYEVARVAAEATLVLKERSAYEQLKGQCVKNKLTIMAALQELT